MGALRVQTALNIREWAGRRKQRPVFVVHSPCGRLWGSSVSGVVWSVRLAYGPVIGLLMCDHPPPATKTSQTEPGRAANHTDVE